MSREELLSVIKEMEHYKSEYLKLLQRVAKHNPKKKSSTVAVDLLKDKVSKNSINDLFKTAHGAGKKAVPIQEQVEELQEKAKEKPKTEKKYPSGIGGSDKKYPSTVAKKKYPSAIKRD